MKNHHLLLTTKANIMHISIFISSLVIYLFTLSPTVCFWDCGEFILSANKLEVGHAPGAPLYLLIARLFSIFVSPEKVAFSINLLSAIAASTTISLLYSTILILLHKLPNTTNSFTNKAAAFIGSFTLTVSDTFWFSAVEAEVYALSLFFTALSFWAVLKWELNHPNKNSWRWILLISLLMGLSIGIHLLNLLIIPIITIIIYTKVNGKSIKNYIFSFVAGVFILFLVQFVFIQHGLFFTKKLEILFVNKLNLPIHSGTIVYFTLLFLLHIMVITACYYFNKKLQLITLCSFLFLFGTTSYALIMIRANAKPSINLNNPSNIFSLESFINREQYGERPLIKGAWFGAIPKDMTPTYNFRVNSNGKYELYHSGAKSIYDPSDLSYLPRMYSSQPIHKSGYLYWSDLEDEQKPALRNQLTYLFKYQIGYMYFRYFMWNFSGRQNHYQGHGDFLKGNFLTGIPFIDKHSVGNRHFLNSLELTSKSRNIYFMLPLIVGIIGFITLIRKSNRSIIIITSVFFLITGPIIALYLNQPPFEPRERDYVFIGSFYAFSIFIAVGARTIINQIHIASPSTITHWAVTMVVFLAIPGLMFANNLNDHNRSDRTLARDLALSYLNSCDQNAILFTYGDNDTYPLWYAQEIEGIRTDIRVVNIGLLSADWYIKQQTIKQNNSNPLSFTIPLNQYNKGELDYVAAMPYKTKPISLFSALNFIADTTASTRLTNIHGEKIDFIPSRNISLNNDSNRLIKLNKMYLTKQEVALFDIIASNFHNRPIYFTNGTPASALMGIKEHTIPYGIITKLVSTNPENKSKDISNIFTDNININYPQKSWFDETCLNAIKVSQLITNCNHEIKKLIEKGHFKKAQNILKKFNPIITLFNYQYEEESMDWINYLFLAKLPDEAAVHLEQHTYITIYNFNFYTHSKQNLGDNMIEYATEEYTRLKKLHQMAKNNKINHVASLIEKIIDID